MSKKLVLAAALGALLSANAMAQAEGPWLVRARAVHLDSVNSDSTGLGLSINDKWIPEVDVSYFFTPSISAELVLTYPQKHTIYARGVEIGSLKHLPPTLTAKYHFTGSSAFIPYVGAGVNYTHFSNVSFDPAVVNALHPSIDSNSFGLAVQAGADIPVAKNVSLNFDVKKVQIRTDVKSSGTKVGTFKVDPVLIGVGVGYRF
jgi:outer membrane protein